MRCHHQVGASSTGSSSATVTRSVVISCSIVTKLCRHPRPRRARPASTPATGVPARWRDTIAAVSVLSR